MASWIGPSFGATGGGFGGMGDTASYMSRAMMRLLSPDEFDQLDPETKSSFGNYMTYLQAYTKRQRAKRDAQSVFNQLRGGGTLPESPAVAFGVAGGAGGGMRGGSRVIPSTGESSTRLRRDMSGAANLELYGQGVRRGMSGRAIPQTPEQSIAIPMRKGRAETAYWTQESSAREAKAKSDFTKTDIERAKLAQADRRIEQSGRRVDQAGERIAIDRQRREDAWNKFTMGMAQDEKMARLRDELERGRMELGNELRGAYRDQSQEFQKAMAVLRGEVPGTPESAQRHAEAAARASIIADAAAQNSAKLEDARANRQQADRLRQYQFFLERFALEGDGLSKLQKNELDRQRAAYGSPPVEVRRNVNGRVAIFDANSRQFLRWEE